MRQNKDIIKYSIIGLLIIGSYFLKSSFVPKDKLLKDIFSFLEHCAIGSFLIYILILRDRLTYYKKENSKKNRFLLKLILEIKNHMNNILGTLSIIQRTKLNDEQNSIIELMRSSGDSLLLTLNDIKDYENLCSGNIQLEKRPLSIRECIDDCINLLSLKAYEKEIDLYARVDPNTPDLYNSDATRIKQILINLINNSLNFTSKGSIVIKVSPSPIHRNFLNFIIIDTGAGIKEEIIPTLFEPFHNINDSKVRTMGDTGLGLSICHELVTLMNGSITIDNNVHEGTICNFSINLEKIENQICLLKEKSDQTFCDLDTTNISDQNIKILLVEDNKINQKVVQMMLQKIGYNCDTADNGKVATEMFKDTKYDVILMDILMPIMDGISAIKEIRNIKSKNLPHIVAMTAKTSHEHKQVCFEAGADDFLSKPVAIEELTVIINSTLKNKDIAS